MTTWPALASPTAPTLYFIGVTTRQSSIMKVFPLWMRELGRPEVVIEGIDLEIHGRPAAYRAVVSHIKDRPLALGALVTTHKIDLLEAARDLFDWLDHHAVVSGEVSCISKRAGRLEGHAKDPITAGLILDAILGGGYFGRTGGWVLCLGAGGAAAATLLHLIGKREAADRPRRFIAVDRVAARLDRLRAMVEREGPDIEVEYACDADPAHNDTRMAALPAGSVVINATGMGKDTPGSPITDAARFPPRGVAWEFNYRGALDFLRQAHAQRAARGLRVEDGWQYFLHGWTQVIAQVLHVDIDGRALARLAALAGGLRQ